MTRDDRSASRRIPKSIRTSCFAATCLLVGALASHGRADDLPVFGLRFSPDGTMLAAASNSGPVALWNVHDWSVRRVHRPAAGTLDVDFSPDGTQLAFAGKNGAVGLLEVATGKLLRQIDAHSNAVYSVAFSSDGKRLASAGADRSVKLWNAETGELIRRFDGHTDTVDGVAISPDGKTLLTGGNDKEARLWDVESGAVRMTFKPSDLIVRRVRFSRDGAYFLVSSWDAKVRIRETSTGRLRCLLNAGSDSADMTADNRLVATSGGGSTAHVYRCDLRDPTPEETDKIAALIQGLRDDRYEVREAAAKEIAGIGLAAERQLRTAAADKDAETRVRARHIRQRVISPEPIAKLSGHRGDVEVVSFSPDGKLLATACRGGDIKVWETAAFRELTTLRIPAEDDEPAR